MQEVKFSDHKALIVDLSFAKSHTDLDLKCIPVERTMAQIRKAATSDQLKQKIKDDPSILAHPLIESLKDILPQRGRVSHWYKHPPKWYLYKEPGGGTNLKQERDREWDALMRQITQAYNDHDTKHFHKLI